MVSLAHLSDVHLSPLPPMRWRDYFNKRVTGYLNWRLKRGNSLDGVGLDRHPDRLFLALVQPAAQAHFTGLAQVGAGGEGDDQAHRGQANQREAGVRNLEKALGDIRCEASQGPGRLS